MTYPLETCRFSSWTFQTQVACSIFYFEMPKKVPKKWYSLQLTICHKHSTRGFRRSWGAASVERSWKYFRYAKPDSLVTWSQNVLNTVACLVNIHHSFSHSLSTNLRKLHPHRKPRTFSTVFGSKGRFPALACCHAANSARISRFPGKVAEKARFPRKKEDFQKMPSHTAPRALHSEPWSLCMGENDMMKRNVAKSEKTLHSSQKQTWSNVVPKFCVGPSTKLHLPNASHLLYFCTACADFEPKEVTCKNSHTHQQQTRLHGALRSSTQSIPQNDQIIQGPFHRSQDSNI